MQPPTDPKQKCVKRGRECSCQCRFHLLSRRPSCTDSLTPGHSGALAHHKHISISLSFVLIPLYSKEKKKKKREVRGCGWVCLCATAPWAGWQRRHCSQAVPAWQPEKVGSAPCIRNRWAAGAGVRSSESCINTQREFKTASPAIFCKEGLGWGVFVNQR